MDFGQMVILILIQVGGLGIMTFSLLFLVMLGKKMSLNSRLSIPTLSQEINLQNIKFALLVIFSFTIVIEGIGALLLFLNLRHSVPFAEAVYSSIFHSIAAFCNAGFSIYSDNLTAFSSHPYILSVIMALIILGGLGFIVIYEIVDIALGKRNVVGKIVLSVHTRIALAGTAIFILGGAFFILLLEGGSLFAGMPAGDKVLNAFFLSVASRTAGFSTVDLGGLSNPALLLVAFLMFVGACPGSTAGGVKIHVFFALMAHIGSKIKGRSSTSIFKRNISSNILDRAATIFIYAIFLLVIAVFVLQITENLDSSQPVAVERGRFLDTLFEAVSAFGTVGLSTGLTAALSCWGKVIIMILMFIGRVGPLTLGIALHMQQQRKVVYEFPTEDVLIN